MSGIYAFLKLGVVRKNPVEATFAVYDGSVAFAATQAISVEARLLQKTGLPAWLRSASAPARESTGGLSLLEVDHAAVTVQERSC